MTPSNPQPGQAVTSLTAKAGEKVDNYTIMEQIGAGGTAIVFRAHDHVLNRNVAIKQLVVPAGDAGDDLRQRALAEAQLHKRAAQADAKLLVQYIDTINDPRGLFLISEYIDGPSLEWILQQEPRPMEQRQALGILAATAKALDALHRTGMVHRDLKPSNVLMPREGGLKLADFGLAAIIAEQQSMDLGSVRYMAPEVLQGEKATAKSDLYSLGIIAYEMLAGRELFNEAFRTILRDQRNQSMRWVKWHTNTRAKVTPLDQLCPGVPESLAQLVARLMEKEPARRVGSAKELIEAIRMHFASGAQNDAATPSSHAAMQPPAIDDVSQTAAVPQRSKLPLILGVTLGVWLLAIGGFFVWKQVDARQQRAERLEAVYTDFHAAERRLESLDYEQAIGAFAKIPATHKFNPDSRSYIGDLVDAGRLKAEGMLAVEQGDYITALDKFNQYKALMDQHLPQPAEPRTGLSSNDATDKIDDYSKRRAFQVIANDISAMMDRGELDDAIQEIRRQRANAGAIAAADVAMLDQLQARYTELINNERITRMLDEAQALLDAGNMRDAIRLLEDEAERAGEKLAPRVATMLGELNKQALIDSIKQRIARAERAGDSAELLDALHALQEAQPSEPLSERVRTLEIAMLIDQAEAALTDNLPEKAERLLNEVAELDPDNTQVARMRETIANARLKVAAVTRGDQFLAQGDYAQAIEQYQQALRYGPDTNGQVNANIRLATGSLNMAKAEDALTAGDVAVAQAALDTAKANLGDTTAVADLQTRIDALRDYTALIDEGDALFAQDDFGRAKGRYLAAKEIFNSETVVQKIRDCDFGIWLHACDVALANRDWEAAESALRRAESIKTNEQTRQRREQVESRIQ